MKMSLKEFLILKKSVQSNCKVKILSRSMEPFIYKGEEILVEKCKPNHFKRFTPIVFWYEEKLICHFYIKKEVKEEGVYYMMKSLDSKVITESVKEEWILGVVKTPSLGLFRRLVMSLKFRSL